MLDSWFFVLSVQVTPTYFNLSLQMYLMYASYNYLGENSTLQPPPEVNIVFEEIVDHEDLGSKGLFTVNVSWTHPAGI